jgi:hypothetical protein
MGLLDRILGRKKADEPGAELTPADVERIVQDYGAALGSTGPEPGCVADTASLPHSKDRIKKALIFALRSTKDSKLREQLKIGYLSLADWQEGVGTDTVGIIVTDDDLSGDPVEVAARIAGQGNTLEKWVLLVSEEQEKLKSELQQLGLW